MIIRSMVTELRAVKCDYCGHLADWVDCQEDARGLAWACGFAVVTMVTPLGETQQTDMCPACQDERGINQEVTP
jgi:hypothetical protein